MSNLPMQGLFPILATPFDGDDRIDVEDLRREVDFVIENGAHGVGIAFASEVVKLSESERDVATRTVVEQAAGRAPVVVNTGAPGTAVTVQYSRRAEELGADASMVTPPVGVSAEVVKEYYRRVSDATTIPIFIQDVPTAAVSPTLAGEMAREIEGVQYIKAENPPTPASIAGFVKEGGDALTVFGARAARSSSRRCVAGRSGSCRTRRCPTCSARCGTCSSRATRKRLLRSSIA